MRHVRQETFGRAVVARSGDRPLLSQETGHNLGNGQLTRDKVRCPYIHYN
jgi:hypothetical protein